MTPSLESICKNLGITAIPTRQYRRPRETHAGESLQRVFDRYGEDYLIMTLRTITESTGNDRALIAPVINALSDILAAHPRWAERGVAWIEAFDNIDLLHLAAAAKENRKAVAPRAAIATMLHSLLSPVFDPPRKPRKYTPERPPAGTPGDVDYWNVRIQSIGPRIGSSYELPEPDSYPPGFPPGDATGAAKPVPGDHQDELARNSDRTLDIECRAKLREISHGAVDRAATVNLNAASLQDPLTLCAATFVHSSLR